jgi:hypothetical protein
MCNFDAARTSFADIGSTQLRADIGSATERVRREMASERMDRSTTASPSTRSASPTDDDQYEKNEDGSIKVFTCDKCGKTYKQRNSLNKHLWYALLLKRHRVTFAMAH